MFTINIFKIKYHSRIQLTYSCIQIVDNCYECMESNTHQKLGPKTENNLRKIAENFWKISDKKTQTCQKVTKGHFGYSVTKKPKIVFLIFNEFVFKQFFGVLIECYIISSIKPSYLRINHQGCTCWTVIGEGVKNCKITKRNFIENFVKKNWRMSVKKDNQESTLSQSNTSEKFQPTTNTFI